MKLNRTTMRTVDILKLVSKKIRTVSLDEICEKLGFQRPVLMILLPPWWRWVWSM